LQHYVKRLDQVAMADVESVGGKNASLGEMISALSSAGVKVPTGFATTAAAYRDFLAYEGLAQRIQDALETLDPEDVQALAQTGNKIRQWILEAPLQPALESAIEAAFADMTQGHDDMAVAVRSSATAEDLPDASFAGQQETFLNIRGLDNIKHAIREVFASLYNDRAISYRVHQGYAHHEVALSAGIQRMVRSETGAAGVMFSLDTESGFQHAVFITSAYGLGETVVQGAVNPDEFYVFKPTLSQKVPAILRRNLGSKAVKMVYAGDGRAGKAVETLDVPLADRNCFSINDQDVHGYRVGQGWR
jgi:pyruvate,water dikinase